MLVDTCMRQVPSPGTTIDIIGVPCDMSRGVVVSNSPRSLPRIGTVTRLPAGLSRLSSSAAIGR